MTGDELDPAIIAKLVTERVQIVRDNTLVLAFHLMRAQDQMGAVEWKRWMVASFKEQSNQLETLCNEVRAMSSLGRPGKYAGLH